MTRDRPPTGPPPAGPPPADSCHTGGAFRMTASSMLLKVLFWLFVTADVAALGLFFVLGLAAAGPSKTNPLAVVFAMLVVPGVILAGCIALFLTSPSAVLRTLAVVVVGAPAGLLAVAPIVSAFLAATTAPGGIWGETPLSRALRELPQDASRLADIRTLLAEGADPNEPGEELPIVLAIRAVSTSGDTALKMLLDAGADPDRRREFGDPAWFSSIVAGGDAAVLRLLLDRGADPKAKGNDGRGGIWSAANTCNWPAAQLLLDRGAPIDGISPMGLPLLATLEAEERDHGGGGGLREVLAAVRARK